MPNEKTRRIRLTTATIKVDSCGITIKGKKLEVGVPIEDWIKVLGKPSRVVGHYVWDDLGIGVSNDNNSEKIVDALYIYFMNFNSEDGKAGMLNFAPGYEAFNIDNWDSKYLKENESRLREKSNPKKFTYPLATYQCFVNLHGGIVKAGMKIKEINSYRKELPFSGLFGYVDDDIDGVNDSRNNVDTFGGDYRAAGTICKNGRLQYYEVTYTGNGNLEYLKIAYEDKSNYENRLLMMKEEEKTKWKIF